MSQENGLLMTIAIPTYKRTDLLYFAIKSAIEQKQAEGIEYEIIVVDNEAGEGENDSQRLVEKFQDKKLKYLKNEKNLGMIGNWNRCLELARGKWIAFLHDDDLVDANYINRMCYYINRCKGAKCIIPNWREVDAEGNEIKSSKKNRRNKKIPILLHKHGIWKPTDLDNVVMNFNFYGAPSCGVLIDRECALKLGGFSEKFQMGGDWEFFVRFSRKYTIYKLNEVLSSYRWAVNASLTIRKQRLKELIEEKNALLKAIYENHTSDKRSYSKFVDLNMHMVEWEWCKNYPEARKYLAESKFFALEVIEFYIWALLRRGYMYFREAFVVR